VNVANLLVAGGAARQREMAIRVSVGAGKVALMRQLIIESVVLSLLGGALGVAFAYAATPLLLRALGFHLSEGNISAQPDWRVLLFSAATTVAAGIAFGLLPAWQSARTDVGSALKGEGGHGHTGRSLLLRRGLIVGQVALSLILVSAGVLFTRSLRNLRNIDVGFNTAHLLTFNVNPLQAGYSQQRIKSFGEELRHSLQTLPGVTSAVIATVPVLMDADEGGAVTVEGSPVTNTPDASGNQYLRNRISAGYFAAMQIPLIAGRVFNDSDTLPASNTAIVNQTFVRRFLPGLNPIGVHFAFGSGRVKFDQTIVGVVADSKHSSIRSQVAPFVYLPYLTDDRLSSLTFYVRVHSDEHTAMPEIRALVHRLDPSLPVNQLSSLAQIIDESLFVERSLGYLSVAFAVLATLLVIVGLYGVMRYSVTRRVRELGIRMALGASPERVVAMVLRESALLGVAGIACAVPFVIATASYLRSSLYGVRPDDPVAWLSAATLLIAVAVAAGFGPAWGASRIDPHAALKTD
jgi:predicted permease